MNCHPNLDALATAGVNFTRTFALYPVCSRSKMALFTGTYPHENSAYRNVTNYGTDFQLVGDPSNLGHGGTDSHAFYYHAPSAEWPPSMGRK